MKKYIPENIDIEDIIANYPVSSIKGFHRDKLNWILSEIAERPYNMNGYAEIHSKRLRSFVHNYNDYLEYAANSRLIDRDMQFYYDIFSRSKVRGYKFTDQYSSTFTGAEINYLPIVKRYAREKSVKLKSCHANSHLVKWFNPSLTIDYDNAIDYLSTYYAEKKRESELLAVTEQAIRNTWYEDYSIKYLELQQCQAKNPYDSYRRAFMSIDRIQEQEYCLSTDSKVRRLHSIITLMPADFRNFLSYEGEELVCLDIRNSQAFFSLNLLNKENIEETISIAKELNKKEGKVYSNIDKILSNLSSSSLILSQSLQRIENEEVERYEKLVLSGRIYDYFEQALREELGITYATRSALKEEFFRVMYSSNKFFGQSAAAPKRMFQKHFPGIFDYFFLLKKMHSDIIPIILLRWESYAILQCIAKRISKSNPEIPLFTVHDSIATTKGNVDFVSSIICKELKNLTGYEPMLKKEEWDITNLKYYNKWRHKQS